MSILYFLYRKKDTFQWKSVLIIGSGIICVDYMALQVLL